MTNMTICEGSFLFSYNEIPENVVGCHGRGIGPAFSQQRVTQVLGRAFALPVPSANRQRLSL